MRRGWRCKRIAIMTEKRRETYFICLKQNTEYINILAEICSTEYSSENKNY